MSIKKHELLKYEILQLLCNWERQGMVVQTYSVKENGLEIVLAKAETICGKDCMEENNFPVIGKEKPQ